MKQVLGKTVILSLGFIFREKGSPAPQEALSGERFLPKDPGMYRVKVAGVEWGRMWIADSCSTGTGGLHPMCLSSVCPPLAAVGTWAELAVEGRPEAPM